MKKIKSIVSAWPIIAILLSHIPCLAVGSGTKSLFQGMIQAIEDDAHLTPQQKSFIISENFVNDVLDPASRRDAHGQNVVYPKFNLQYFKVPLHKTVEYQIENLLDPRIKDALIFKEGEDKYLKWPIYPEDRKYYLETMKLLKAQGLNEKDVQPLTENPQDPCGLDSYLTASRSILIHSRKNGVAFTVKGSTNYVGGKQEIAIIPKILKGEEAKNIITANKYVSDLMPKKGHENLIMLMEPLAFVIEEKDNIPSKGLVIRDLRDLGGTMSGGQDPQKKFYYIPGFSVIQEKNLPFLKNLVSSSLGKNADEVSSDDLNAFVINHYAIPAGKAMAELLAYYGIAMTSLHGQQVLLQLDLKGIPTGKIALRDFTDGILITKMVPNKEAQVVAQCCFDKQRKPDSFPAMNLIKFHKFPSWAGEKESQALRKWMLKYENAFNRTLSQITGIPAEEARGYVRLLGRTGGGRYSTRDWDPYLKKFHQRYKIN